MWDSLSCDYVDPPASSVLGRPTSQCLDDAAGFTLATGCILILASVGATQVSNRGFLATCVLPILTMIISVWASIQTDTHLSSLLILPLMAAWVSGIACFSGSGASAQWSEATATALSFSILLCQMIIGGADNIHLNLVRSQTLPAVHFVWC